MRTIRTFVELPLTEGRDFELPRETYHHLVQVLRSRTGQQLQLFNGRGGHYPATITRIDRRRVTVRVHEYVSHEVESALAITLGHCLVKGQRMDFVVQKAVELGVQRIVPLLSCRSNVRLDAVRAEKKMSHWRKIIVAACEQCGRNRLPALDVPVELKDWLMADTNRYKIFYSKTGQRSLPQIKPVVAAMTLLIGPEGGFTDEEERQAMANGYTAVRLGPRILRSDTAAVAALSACQALWGDFR